MAFRSLFAFVLAVILILVVISTNLLHPGIFAVYYHFATFLFLGGGMFLLTFVNYSPGEILTSFRILFSPPASRQKEDYDLAARIFRTMSRYAWAVAGIAFLVGLIRLLLQITDPSTIAPNLVFSITAILYGLFWGEMACGLCEVQAVKRLSEFGWLERSAGDNGWLFSTVIIMFIAVLFIVIWYALIRASIDI